MPTDEWFKENPKVAAYIPKELNDKLLEWMQNKNIKKVSQALTAILEEQLGVVQVEPKNQPYLSRDRMEEVESKITALSQKFEEMESTIARMQAQEQVSPPVDQSSNSQLSLLEAPPEEVQKTEDLEEKEVVQVKLNSPEIWTTKQLQEVGVSRNSLTRWKNSTAFPKDSKGFRILKYAGKQSEKPFGDLWEVEPLKSQEVQEDADQ